MQGKQSQVGDYFGTFLDTLNERPSSGDPSQSSASQGSSSQSSVSPPPTEDSQSGAGVTVLEKPAASLAMVTQAVGLLSTSESRPVTELQTQMGVGFADFGGLISNLHELGLIAISGEPGAELIGLTRQGRLLAQMS